MKRNLAISTALIAFLFVLAGCSKTPTNTQNTQNEQQGSKGSKSGQDQNFGRSKPRMPDFGQPDKKADVRGVVKSVLGNEVTVIKIDMPGRASSSPEQISGASSAEKTNKPTVSLSGAGSEGGRGGMGGRGAGGPGGFGGEQSSTSRADMLEKLKAMSSGEEKITIPVGIKMLKRDTESGTGSAPKMVEATLADITSDKMLTIWLNASITDKKVAEFILIN